MDCGTTTCGCGDVARFGDCFSPSSRARGEVSYGVGVQSDLLSGLRTRSVMPLKRLRADMAHLPRRLSPLFTVQAESLELSHLGAPGLDARLLRHPVASPAAHGGEIRDALDAVVSGV